LVESKKKLSVSSFLETAVMHAKVCSPVRSGGWCIVIYTVYIAVSKDLREDVFVKVLEVHGVSNGLWVG
jgi:hypothetical protein